MVGFYKQPYGEQIFYYRQEVPRSEVMEVEFTEEDRVIKNEAGKWVKKPLEFNR